MSIAPTLEAERAAPELLPCPFCSSATADAIENQTYGGYMVMCNDCTADGGLRETRAEAIAAWNRRTAAPVAEGVALPPLDAEGLPPLPIHDWQDESAIPRTGGYQFWLYDSVRQAQREAVAADRRSRISADQWASLEAARLQLEAAELNRKSRVAHIDGRTAGTEWISVEDELPEPGARLLVTRFAGRVNNPAHPGHPGVPWIEVTRYMANGSMFECDIISTGYVTHWMPLPAAPSPLPPQERS